jgi:hypothetical protein
LQKEAKRHHLSEAEYIRIALRKHLKEELQAHLGAGISGVGYLENGAALQSLHAHVTQYVLGCRRRYLSVTMTRIP